MGLLLFWCFYSDLCKAILWVLKDSSLFNLLKSFKHVVVNLQDISLISPNASILSFYISLFIILVLLSPYTPFVFYGFFKCISLYIFKIFLVSFLLHLLPLHASFLCFHVSLCSFNVLLCLCCVFCPSSCSVSPSFSSISATKFTNYSFGPFPSKCQQNPSALTSNCIFFLCRKHVFIVFILN